MAGIVLTVTSGKGGVGKTTTAANVSVALAMTGQTVVVIDADIGLRNLDIVMGLEGYILYDLIQVVEGRCALEQALIRDKRLDNLYILPASQTKDKMALAPEQMVAVCNELRTWADYILIDSPAGIERGFQNAIAPADEILLVTTPEVSSLRDADKVIYLLERHVGLPPRLVINRYNVPLVRRGDMLSRQDVLDILAVDLLGVVPEDDEILVAMNRGHPIAFNQNAYASMAYHNIARRILGYNVPLMPFRDQTLWQRIRSWLPF